MYPNISLFIQSLNKAGIAANLSPAPLVKTRIKCYYQNNADGSIRWIWPASSTQADFLKFNQNQGLGSSIIAASVKILSKAGVLKQVSDGEFYIYTSDNNYTTIAKKRWAWFSGTHLINKASILWYQDATEKFGVFAKISLTQRAEENQYAETQIKSMHQLSFEYISLLEAETIAEGCLQLAGIEVNTFGNSEQVNALKQWFQSNTAATPYNNYALQKAS